MQQPGVPFFIALNVASSAAMSIGNWPPICAAANAQHGGAQTPRRGRQHDIARHGTHDASDVGLGALLQQEGAEVRVAGARRAVQRCGAGLRW